MNERVRIQAKKPDAKRENRALQTRKTNLSQSINSPADRILFLQRTIGNQAVQRLIKSGSLQTKLRIGKPNDIYEQEAERVADAVMQMPEPQAVSSGTPYIQRACPLCEEEELRQQPIEEEEEKLQAKATSGYIFEVNPDIKSHLQNIRGGGQPLSQSECDFFEPRFGSDFSQVRLHTDTRATEVAQAMNARAFTVGWDVVFGEGQYEPGTSKGKRLLAHELTHVVQQSVSPYRISNLYLSNVLTAPMIQCNENAAHRTITDFESDIHYCKDTTFGGLLHRGVCFRQVVGPCDRGRHVCIDSGTVTTDHYDEFSPVERREPNGECNYHIACAYSHIVTEVPAAYRFPYLRRLAMWLKEQV